MRIIALSSWFGTAFAGLYLLAIWLIEYDISAPGGAVSRLPRTVIGGHVLLASRSEERRVGNESAARDMPARIDLGALLAVVLLGLTMLGRWHRVRRQIAVARS